MREDKTFILGCAFNILFFGGILVMAVIVLFFRDSDKKNVRMEYVATPEIRRVVYNSMDSIFGDRLDVWNAELVDSPLTIVFYGHYDKNPYAPIFEIGSTELSFKKELSDFIYEFVLFLSDTNVSNYVDAVTIRTFPGSYEINAIPEISRLLAAEKKRIYGLFWNTDSIWNHNTRLRDYKENMRDTIPVLPEYMNVYYDWLVCYQGADELGRSEFRMRNTIPFSIGELFGDTVNPYRFDWDIPYCRPMDWILFGEEEPVESKLEEDLVSVIEQKRKWSVYGLWNDICDVINDEWIASVVAGGEDMGNVYNVEFKFHVFPYMQYEYYESEVLIDTPFLKYSRSGEIRTSERILFRVWFEGEETREMRRIGDSIVLKTRKS